MSVVLALLGSACGNNDKNGNDGNTSSNTTKSTAPTKGTTTGVTDTEIRLSAVGTLTGPNAAGEEGFDKGFEAYIEALNERGGVNGRTIKLVSSRDDASEPARQVSEFQQAVEQDKPFAVILGSGNFAAADYAAQNNIPVAGWYTDTGWHKSDGFFGANLGSWKAADVTKLPKAPKGLTGAGQAYLALRLGAESMGVFGYNISASAKSANDVCADVVLYGVKCGFNDTTLQFGFTDIGASIAKIKSSGSKFLYAAMDVGGCITILRSLKRAGLDDIKVQCATGYDADNVGQFSDVIGNMLTVANTAPFELGDSIPELKTFLTEMKARKPGAKLAVATLSGWATGVFIEDVLKEMGDDVTRENFVKTARTAAKFKSWNANGIVNRLDWTTNRWDLYSDPSYKLSNACYGYLLRPDLKTKKWTQVGPKPQFCVKDMDDPAAFKKWVKSDKSDLDVS